MAAPTGMIGGSPIPLTPKGPFGEGFWIRIVSMLGTQSALGKSYYKLNKNKKVKETLDILNMLDRSLYQKLYSEIGMR